MFFFKNIQRKRGLKNSGFLVESLEERAMMTTVIHDLASDFSEIGSPAEADNWSLNAGNKELSQRDGWAIKDQPIWAALSDPQVSQFRSAEDLDLNGDFPYAVNAGGAEVTIGDVTFADGTLANDTGIIGGSFQIADWYPDADYGDLDDDNALEKVMESIRWERSPGISIELDVESGQAYKLQMLFAELWVDRGFDIYMEGEEVFSDLAVYAEQGGINQKDTGVVFTHEFIALDDQLTVGLVSDDQFANIDNYIQAFTLEKLGAPLWLQAEDAVAETDFEGFELNDVLVMPSLDGSGYGAANVTWTSSEDTMISVDGGLWTVDDGVGDFQWRLDLNSEELTSGTLLANQFTGEERFDLRAGAGGREAVRNLLVEEGDELRLTVTGSEPEFVAVDLSVTSDSLQIPRYTLGEIPTQDATSGEPISFFVDVSDAVRDTLSMSLNDAASLASLDATGLFTYVPNATNRFDTTVNFEVVDGGVHRSQQVTIRTHEIRSEYELVGSPGDLPDAKDDIVVTEQGLAENVFFNGVEREKTRRIEISGKQINLVPGHANGLFEDLVYTDGVANSDIREFSIYAETVIVGGKLWMPGTDITIYAKELVFQDGDGTAEINTTPLNFISAAANAQLNPGSHISPYVPGENGKRGQDAGDLTLYVRSVILPQDDVGASRFILKGGMGQAAGAGQPGADGASRRVLTQQDMLAAGFLDPSRLLIPINFPNTTYVEAHPLIGSSTKVGQPYFPGDGKDAIPGGRPGSGGAGGNLTTSIHGLDAITDLSGGDPGAKAANQPGGRAGTPRTARHISIPWIGAWDTDNQRTSSNGSNWTAPSASAGNGGSVFADIESDWLHPASMRAMISYAKNAYLSQHNELAAELFNEYGNLLDGAVSASPEFAAQYTEMRSEVSTYEHQLAIRLDYFGNPAGWAPTLSFGANYKAFQNAIESDLKTLFLTRLVQKADADQQSKLVALDELIGELDKTIEQATTDLNDAQEKLPQLQVDMQNIMVETEVIQTELDAREALLESQAESNVFARQTLSTIGGLLSVVPIPAVSALGGGLNAVNSFVADPSLGGFVGAAHNIADPFKQETLDASSEAISEQLDLLDPPSKANQATLIDYGSRLAKVGAQWGPAVSAFQEVATATQLPMDEIDAELQRLKAQDPQFNELIAQLESMLAKKQAFAAKLTRTMNAISTNLNTITTGYATADTLNQERSIEAEQSLSHSTLDRVHEMARNARDRLLQYQYNLAKAFEYETLEAYPGDLGLSKTFGEIVRLLDDENAGVNFLDVPANFAALESVYESELREVADPIWAKLNTNGPQRTSEIKLTLSTAQLAELNQSGEVTINLIDEGFVNAARQDVKLVQMGVESVASSISDQVALQAANLQFRFEHSGRSIVQSKGTKYQFRHLTSEDDNAFFWSTDYDAIGGDLTQSGVSPSDVDAVSALLGVEVGSLRSPYAHPGARSDITIRTSADVVPRSTDINIQELTLFVRYDSGLPESDTVLLDVRTPEGMSPRILVDQAGSTSRDDGEGDFTRFYEQGQRIVLTAEPSYSGVQFTGWRNDRDERIGDDPTLTIVLNKNMRIRATYASTGGPLAGDANRDGIFNSSDLVSVFQAGEYDDAVDGNSTWEEGDWNGDGDFDSGDLVLAFQIGNYEKISAKINASVAAAVDWVHLLGLDLDESHRRRFSK